MKRIIILAMLVHTAGIALHAQKVNDSLVNGQFSLGVRSTFSTFTDAGSEGMGAGGQFWIRVSKHLNTVWYADYITSDIRGLGYRRDAHIGWSVVFYLNKKPLSLHKITPLILAGQCFDYTQLYSNYLNQSAERWSAAAPQGGAGITYNFTDNFNLSLFLQYMLHLGTHVESSVLANNYGQQYLYISREQGASLDGHLLFTLSVNYKLGRL